MQNYMSQMLEEKGVTELILVNDNASSCSPVVVHRKCSQPDGRWTEQQPPSASSVDHTTAPRRPARRNSFEVTISSYSLDKNLSGTSNDQSALRDVSRVASFLGKAEEATFSKYNYSELIPKKRLPAESRSLKLSASSLINDRSL
eukprot:scaffold6673_cov134-Cylindrotheca_fusiformis.AAC.1